MTEEKPKPYKLRAERAYWEQTPVEDINELSKEQLIDLVKELDRRFIQLWDKVKYEADHNLVDYGKLK